MNNCSVFQRIVLRLKMEGLRIWNREPWWAEFWPACGALGWAALVFITKGTMADRPSLAVLGHLMGDEWWTVLVGLLGAVQLFALFTYRRILRWYSCLVASCFWWFCAIVIVQSGNMVSDPAAVPLSLALYCMAALPCTYSGLRLKWDVG